MNLLGENGISELNRASCLIQWLSFQLLNSIILLKLFLSKDSIYLALSP